MVSPRAIAQPKQCIPTLISTCAAAGFAVSTSCIVISGVITVLSDIIYFSLMSVCFLCYLFYCFMSVFGFYCFVPHSGQNFAASFISAPHSVQLFVDFI